MVDNFFFIEFSNSQALTAPNIFICWHYSHSSNQNFIYVNNLKSVNKLIVMFFI